MRDWLCKLVCQKQQAELPRHSTGGVPETKEIKELNAFYYDVAMAKLNSQFRKINSIDTRSTSYFTIGSAILPIVAGFLVSDESPLSHSIVAKYALLAGFACYILLAVFYVWSFLYSGWDSRPDAKQWKTVTTQFELKDLERWLGDACVEAYENNEPAIERKAGKSALALWFLAGEAVSLSIAVIAPLWPIS